MKRLLIGLMGLVAAVFTSSASAQSVTVYNGVTPQQYANLLQRGGFQIDQITQIEGTPAIVSSYQGLRVVTVFAGCQQGRCPVYQHFTAFNSGLGDPANQLDLNRLNSGLTITSVFAVQAMVYLRSGAVAIGVTEEYLASHTASFLAEIQLSSQYFNSGGAGVNMSSVDASSLIKSLESDLKKLPKPISGKALEKAFK